MDGWVGGLSGESGEMVESIAEVDLLPYLDFQGVPERNLRWVGGWVDMS